MSESSNLSDQINTLSSFLCRVIEHVTLSNIRVLENETILNCIQYTISELTRHDEPKVLIQNPCKEILVSIGMFHCKLVMEELTKLLQPHAVGHFMVLETMGQLARSNLNDSVEYIKPTLGMVIPMMSLVKKDFQKHSYANAFQQFCDALTEFQSNAERDSTASNLSNEPDMQSSNTSLNEIDMEISTEEGKPTLEKSLLDISAEIGISYDVIHQQWLNTRDSKLSAHLLKVLSYMYPLLPKQKISDNTNKIINSLLMMYNRQIDRASINIFLSSVIQTTQKIDPQLLDAQSDAVIIRIFDVINATPDFENPVASRSHNEVLRCYDLLTKTYGSKVMEVIHTKFKSNDDRDKVKALMLLTHLTNTRSDIVGFRKSDFTDILKQLVMNEKQFRMKTILLKAVMAFAQKGFIQDSVFAKFLIHHCCRLVKILPEQGTRDDENEFIRDSRNSLIILARTSDKAMDDLLKAELLLSFMLYEYTEATMTFAKCLVSLFQKNPDMYTFEEDEMDEENPGVSQSNPKLPSAESVFVRMLVLMADFEDKDRIIEILKFTQQFCPNLAGKHLQPLWNEKIPEMIEIVKIGDDDKLYKELNKFLMTTIKDIDDVKFSESLVNKMSDQYSLYMTQPYVPPQVINQITTEVIVPNLRLERGMLLKIIGICVCYVSEKPSVESKIDLIINQVRLEKLEKLYTIEEIEEKFIDPAKALGFVSIVHYENLMKKFELIIMDDTLKKSSKFFPITFTKDTQKENEKFRLRLLIIYSFYYMVQNTHKENILNADDNVTMKLIEYLNRQLLEIRECKIKEKILLTLLNISNIYLEQNEKKVEFKFTNDLLNLILRIPISNELGKDNFNAGNWGYYDYLPLFPTILKLATNLIKLSPFDDENLKDTELLNNSAHNFFTAAQNLNADNEVSQSYLAPNITSSIPELNLFIKMLLQRKPSPDCLDDIVSVLEPWLKEKNPQVRICAGLILESTLECYTRTVKIGGEAPTKFHQTGLLIGKVVPRCIDSNGRVREIYVNILKKILKLACIYETLTIPDEENDWMKELNRIKEQITIEDNDAIVNIAKEIASIIAQRLTSHQYVAFSKHLLYQLNDSDPNACSGGALVLNYFIQMKGSEMFHAIPDIIKDSFHALKTCENEGTRGNLFLSLVSLTKHHPKLVCEEMLLQTLPYDKNICEFWKTLASDVDLTGVIVDNFLEKIFEMKPYENPEDPVNIQKILSHTPFAVMCALKEIIFSDKVTSNEKFKSRLSPLFAMLLTTLATYTNTVPSTAPLVDLDKIKVPNSTSKSSKVTRFSFLPNRDVVKINPSAVVMDTFVRLMDNLGFEQIKNTLQMFPQLVTSADLNNFAEFLPTLAIACGNTFSVNSSQMNGIITSLSRYMTSPVEARRVALIGFYSQIVPLKPCGDISSVIMLHLTGGLADPVPIVRGFCIRGLAYVGALSQHDIEKYSELALSALIKSIDDYNEKCLINIPLESLRGLSRVIEKIKKEKLELFEVSLTIRIRPFIENSSIEIREAAILLFGDICHQTRLKGNIKDVSELLTEQIISNLFPFLFHLGENESIISRVSRPFE